LISDFSTRENEIKMVDESKFKRLQWHSRRGMLELDLVLMPF